MFYNNKYYYIFIYLNLLIIISVAKKGLAQDNKTEDDPCDPYKPTVPNFFMNNRRLSIAKCYEYIWLIKYRLDKADREKKCIEKKTGYYYGAGIGGRDTYEGEFPHMGAIGWKANDRKQLWHFACGGSLISDRFILTAGHCTRAVPDSNIADPTPKIVRLGTTNISNNRAHVDVDILKIIPHEKYAPPKKYFDIALIELAEPVVFTKSIQPACLMIDYAVEHFGPDAIATGWGVTQINGPPSEELQAVNLRILDSSTCNPLLACNRNWCGLQDHQICAGNLSGGVDTCSGDSGGPLQIKLPLPGKYSYRATMQGIVGITSFGTKCALKDSPGVYTKVSYFLDWIEEIVWRS